MKNRHLTAQEVLALWVEGVLGPCTRLKPKGYSSTVVLFGLSPAEQGRAYVCNLKWYRGASKSLWRVYIVGKSDVRDRRIVMAFERKLAKQLRTKPLILSPMFRNPGLVEDVDKIVSDVEVAAMERRVLRRAA
jgi:hypothetical protein